MRGFFNFWIGNILVKRICGKCNNIILDVPDEMCDVRKNGVERE